MINGELVKVSDAIPKIAGRIDGVYYPGSPYTEYFNGRTPYHITSKGEKKAIMNAKGIREMSSDDSEGVKFEKTGKIFSYNGQTSRNRTKHQKANQASPLSRETQKRLATNMK
jgi:hypothetical protein